MYKEEVGQIVSLGDSRIKRVWDCIAILSMLTVCEFGGFENVLRDAGIRAIPI